MNRLDEIRPNDFATFHWVSDRDMTWLIQQIESLRKQVAQMSAEIEDAHQALDELGMPNDGKSLLSERLECLKPGQPGLKAGYKYNVSICEHCKREVADNWYIRHVKSGCKIGAR